VLPRSPRAAADADFERSAVGLAGQAARLENLSAPASPIATACRGQKQRKKTGRAANSLNYNEKLSQFCVTR